MDIHNVDENAPWRNDPLAKRAVIAAREWNVHNRKGKESIRPQQQAVVDYGMVLLDVRKQHVSNNKYKDDVLARRLDIPPFNEPRERTAALTIAECVHDRAKSVHDLVVNGMFEGCDATNAQMMVRWARKTGLILPKKRDLKATIQARHLMRATVENGQPVKRDEISEATGLSDGAVGRAQAMEQARLEGVAEGEANVLNAREKFTKAQDKHVQALIKKFKRDLDAQFIVAVEKQVNNLVAARKAALDQAREAVSKQRNDLFRDQQYWKKLINNHKPPLTMEEFNDIIFCTHWDQRKALTEERANRAFAATNAKKLQLTGK